MPQTYPYYIVTWTEGRLPCPPHYRMLPVLRRMFESGQLGGRRRCEEDFTSTIGVTQKVHQLKRDGKHPEVYVVRSARTQRHRIPWPPKS